MKLMMLLMVIILIFPLAYACGGRDAFFVDNPQGTFSDAQYKETYNTYLYYDDEGNLLLDKEMVKISKEVADDIIEDFLDENHPEWEKFSFESFDLEHGRPVYMYEAHVPDVALTYHVGVGNFVTDHVHLHVDALTGELLDIGCGGGPSRVLSDYSGRTEGDFDWDKIMPDDQTYFYTEFIIPEGKKPKVDGKISSGEWDDAKQKNVHFGTTEEEIISYGCGGPGKPVNNFAAEKEVKLYTKIVGGMLYVAVSSESPDWIGLMLKDFPHHGMMGDFGDVKIMTTQGISDYYLSSDKNSDEFVAKEGLHGCYGYGKLVSDTSNNLLQTAQKKNGRYIYEMAFPLDNEDPADSHWQRDKAYQISMLMGSSESFSGLTKDTMMSGQETIRLAEQKEYDFVVYNGKVDLSHDHDSHDHGEADEEQYTLFSRILQSISKIFV